MAKYMMVHDEEGRDIYPIYIEQNFNRLIETALEQYNFTGRKVCIVSDSTVAPLYLETVTGLFTEAGAAFTGSYVIPAGEASKNLDCVTQVYEYLIQNHFDRSDLLVALGGGVVGDLCGFTAATYLRGIRFIQIPTTLLSQVDSSVGGKTGVDFKAYKNMVGAFYMPILVYMNTAVLHSMSERDYLSGMGEVVKYGMIGDEAFFHYIEDHVQEVLARDDDTLEYITYISADSKRRVVEEDPKEKGIRALLNLGHTVGHAVEKLMNFQLLHGECVSIGCVMSARLSFMRGLITEEELNAVIALFDRLNLPVAIPADLDPEAILATTKSDKKMNKGQIRFILMDHFCHSIVDSSVSEEEMLSAIKASF